MPMQVQVNTPEQTQLETETTLMQLAVKHMVADLTNNAEYQSASKLLGRVKKKYSTLETQRKNITKPLDEAKKQVMALYKPVLASLKDLEGNIKRKMVNYNVMLDKKRKEEEAKARQQAANERKKLQDEASKHAAAGDNEMANYYRDQADMVPNETSLIEKAVAPGVSVRATWKGEVTDIAALIQAVAAGKAPGNLLLVNTQELNALARALKSELNIPGVKAVKVKNIASRL